MNRRSWLARALAGAGLMATGACDQLTRAPGFRQGLRRAQSLTQAAQRLFLPRTALAREYSEADIAPVFKQNGSRTAVDPAYQAHLANGFADWRLIVDGLVEAPQQISLAELRAMPSRTQITRHDCVEGWSAIGKWKGAMLAPILERARLRANAHYLVFHCADAYDRRPDGVKYYESIDLVDAYHPQTILAYELNDQTLPEAHGAPIRLRVERQLGYKQAKFVMRIEAVESFAEINGGNGGYWEDLAGYEWYAGI